MRTQTQSLPVLELIDWAERYPNESAFQIAVRQSMFCTCGQAKEIGTLHCVPISHEVKQ
jgi:hypothetical protein